MTKTRITSNRNIKIRNRYNTGISVSWIGRGNCLRVDAYDYISQAESNIHRPSLTSSGKREYIAEVPSGES